MGPIWVPTMLPSWTLETRWNDRQQNHVPCFTLKVSDSAVSVEWIRDGSAFRRKTGHARHHGGSSWGRAIHYNCRSICWSSASIDCYLWRVSSQIELWAGLHISRADITILRINRPNKHLWWWQHTENKVAHFYISICKPKKRSELWLKRRWFFWSITALCHTHFYMTNWSLWSL